MNTHTLLLITVAKSLILPQLSQTVDEIRPVEGVMMESKLAGTAATKGTLTADLAPSENSIRFVMKMTGDVESHTTGVNRPKTDVAVNLTTTSWTKVTATKTFALRPEGLSAQPATARAGKTNLFYEGIAVTAPSLIAKQAAEREAWSEATRLKDYNAGQTSRRVERETAQALDDEATKQLDIVNHIYRSIFWEPVFGAKTRTLGLSSTGEAMTATISAPLAEAPTPPPKFDAAGGNEISLRLHDALATAYFAEGVTKPRYDEEDLEEYLILHGIPAPLAHYKSGDAQAVFTPCKKGPVAVAFKTLMMELEACYDDIELQGKKTGPVRVTLGYVSHVSPDGTLDMGRVEEPAFTPEVSDEIKKRFARLFPEQISLPAVRIGSGKPLVVHRADLGDGWLTAELWRRK